MTVGINAWGHTPRVGRINPLPYKPIVRTSHVALISLFLSQNTPVGLYSIQIPLSYELLHSVVSTNVKLPEDQKIMPCSLAKWLHKTYFNDEKYFCFTEAEIQAAGDLLRSMMQYRPSNRPQACQLLGHRWFRTSCFKAPS